MADAISDELPSHGPPEDTRVQMSVVMMLDGDVEMQPGSGSYSSMLETPPKWITYDGPERADNGN